MKAQDQGTKDIDESKTPMKTPLLPDEFFFDGLCLAELPLMKLED